MADALKKDADTVFGQGATQSSQARQMAATAAKPEFSIFRDVD